MTTIHNGRPQTTEALMTQLGLQMHTSPICTYMDTHKHKTKPDISRTWQPTESMRIVISCLGPPGGYTLNRDHCTMKTIF